MSVIDDNRQPVQGLKAGDFTVLENGTPQPIAAFTEVSVQPPEEPAALWMRDVPPDIRRNDTLEDKRITVIVLDDAQVPPGDPRIANRVKEIGRDIVGRLGPTDLTAVVYTLDSRKSHELTDDRDKLLAAVERFTPGYGDGEELYQRYAVETLGKLAERLAEVPQRRKTIFYVSVGVPVDVEAAAAPVSVGTFGDASGRYGLLLQKMRDLFRSAQLGNVNIHSIDPSALYAGVGGVDRFRLHRDFLQTVSANTGGLAVVNREDFEAGLSQIFRENGSYYLLGYQSTNPAADGRFRRLEVRVNRPGLTVRARSGYYAERPATGKPAEESPLVKAISGLLPKPDFPMQVSATPFALPGKREAGVAIVLGMVQDVTSETARVVEKVDLLVNAFGQDGSRASSQTMNAAVALRAGISGKVGYEILSRIDLRPGRYQLRLAAHLLSQKKSGSIYYDIDVPDFSKEPLSLSGVVMNVVPGLAVAPKDRLASLIPILPTTHRHFLRSDKVGSYLRVYQLGQRSAKSVVMTARLSDDTGAIVFSSTQKISAEVFATPARAAGFDFELPLTRLTPGPHVVTFEATTGTSTVSRHVRFSVRQGP